METNAAGEPVGGESKRVGALPGKTERSKKVCLIHNLLDILRKTLPYCGETSGMVQLMGAELLLREQEPTFGQNLRMEKHRCALTQYAHENAGSVNGLYRLSLQRSRWSDGEKGHLVL